MKAWRQSVTGQSRASSWPRREFEHETRGKEQRPPIDREKLPSTAKELGAEMISSEETKLRQKDVM